jgi:hypothetical protein
MEVGAKLQALYDAEVNYRLSTFWDGGFTVRLGDDLDGWQPERNFPTLEDAVDWLLSEAGIALPIDTFDAGAS